MARADRFGMPLDFPWALGQFEMLSHQLDDPSAASQLYTLLIHPSFPHLKQRLRLSPFYRQLAGNLTSSPLIMWHSLRMLAYMSLLDVKPQKLFSKQNCRWILKMITRDPYVDLVSDMLLYLGLNSEAPFRKYFTIEEMEHVLEQLDKKWTESADIELLLKLTFINASWGRSNAFQRHFNHFFDLFMDIGEDMATQLRLDRLFHLMRDSDCLELVITAIIEKVETTECATALDYFKLSMLVDFLYEHALKFKKHIHLNHGLNSAFGRLLRLRCSLLQSPVQEWTEDDVEFVLTYQDIDLLFMYTRQLPIIAARHLHHRAVSHQAVVAARDEVAKEADETIGNDDPDETQMYTHKTVEIDEADLLMKQLESLKLEHMDEVLSITTQHQTELDQLRQQLSEQKHQLLSQLDEYRQRIADLQSQHDKEVKQLEDQLEKQQEDSREAFQAKIEEMDEMRVECDVRIVDLETRLADVTRERDGASVKVEQLERIRSELETTQVEQIARIEDLERVLDETRTERNTVVGELEQQLETLTKSTSDVQAQLEFELDVKHEEITSLQATLADRDAEKARLTSELAKVQNEVEELGQDVEELETELDKAEKMIELLRSTNVPGKTRRRRGKENSTADMSIN